MLRYSEPSVKAALGRILQQVMRIYSLRSENIRAILGILGFSQTFRSRRLVGPYDSGSRITWQVGEESSIDDFTTITNYEEDLRRIVNTKRFKPLEDFFEEYTGKLLEDLGCRQPMKHPPLGNGFADFLATTPSGQEFYVESTVVHPEQFSRLRPTEEDVCRKLDEMCRVPYVYWFNAWASGELYEYLAKKNLWPIKTWIEGLADECPKPQSANFSFPSGIPPRDAETPSEVWEVEINATPRSKSKRGIPDQLLAGFGRSGGVDSVSPLIRATRAKMRQHKNVRKPLVLAINDVADFPGDRIDISLALFGWEQSAETGVSCITPLQEGSRRRSIWGKQENSTISGILLFQGLRPGTEHNANICLYENPWARHPIPHWLKETFPHAYVAEKHGGQYLYWPPDERLSTILQTPE